MAYFSVAGDSISTFEGITPEGWSMFFDKKTQVEFGVTAPSETWWGRVIDHFGGELLRNGAWSGCCVEGIGFPAGESEKRVEALGTGENEPDHILVYMGLNDYGWGSGIKQAQARSLNAPQEWCAITEYALPELADETDAAAFGAGYERMLDRMKERWPKAKIWAFTILPARVTGAGHSTFAYRFRSVEFEKYNQALLDAAEKAGAYGIDVTSLGYDYDALDGGHPTNLGMRQMAAMFIHGIQVSPYAEEMPQTAKLDWDQAKRELLAGFEQADLCDKPYCVGCEYARSTGYPWSCVCEKDL